MTTGASLTLALGCLATATVFMAAVCSFMVVCGFGFAQGIIKKAMAEQSNSALRLS